MKPLQKQFEVWSSAVLMIWGLVIALYWAERPVAVGAASAFSVLSGISMVLATRDVISDWVWGEFWFAVADATATGVLIVVIAIAIPSTPPVARVLSAILFLWNIARTLFPRNSAFQRSLSTIRARRAAPAFPVVPQDELDRRESVKNLQAEFRAGLK